MMYGVTGRMGLNQHLVRSILAIREQGGVALPNGDRVMPDPDPGRPQCREGRGAGASNTASSAHTTDLDAALKNPDDEVFFDAGDDADARRSADESDRGRQARLLRKAGRGHARQGDRGREARQAKRSRTASCRTSCSCRACARSEMLRDAGFFGRMFAVRGEFGYWVFEGDWGQPAQRPSWNYRKAEGGGIILDMLCHWRYVLDNLFGKVQARELPRRDAYSKARRRERQDIRCRRRRRGLRDLQLEGGVIAHINSSWDVRVRRDDLVTFQVDGTHGSAVAGLTKCWTQHRVEHAAAGMEPGHAADDEFFLAVGGGRRTTSFMRMASRSNGKISSATSCADTPWHHELVEGVKGVQLAELGLKSWSERRWLDVPEIKI